MNELLIFLLLLFFIENKPPIFKPITNPFKTIQKPNKQLDSKPTEEPIKQRIFCEGGKIIFGICKCPKGLKNYNGKRTKQPPVKCEGGNLYGSNCICPRGTKLKNGKCDYWLRTTEINNLKN